MKNGSDRGSWNIQRVDKKIDVKKRKSDGVKWAAGRSEHEKVLSLVKLKGQGRQEVEWCREG